MDPICMFWFGLSVVRGLLEIPLPSRDFTITFLYFSPKKKRLLFSHGRAKVSVVAKPKCIWGGEEWMSVTVQLNVYWDLSDIFKAVWPHREMGVNRWQKKKSKQPPPPPTIKKQKTQPKKKQNREVSWVMGVKKSKSFLKCARLKVW